MLATAFTDTQSPVPPVNRVFDQINAGYVARSAAQAKALGFLRPQDKITMNKDRLLFDAKMRVIDLVNAGYQPPKPLVFLCPGQTGAASFDLILETGSLAMPNKTFGKTLADLLCGDKGGLNDNVSEQQMMEAEAKAFIKLCQVPETLACIKAACG